MSQPIEIECRPLGRLFSDQSVRLHLSYGALVIRRSDHPALAGRALAAHGGRYVVALGTPAPTSRNVRRRPFASLVEMPVAAYPADPAALAGYRADLARSIEDGVDVVVSHGANLVLRAEHDAHDFQLDLDCPAPVLVLRHR